MEARRRTSDISQRPALGILGDGELEVLLRLILATSYQPLKYQERIGRLALAFEGRRRVGAMVRV
jgi:hypothetical protein